MNEFSNYYMQKMLMENKPNYLRRIFATLFDYAVALVVLALVLKNFGEALPDGGYHASGLPALIPIAFWFLYFPLSEYWFGATLAMYLLDLKVVRIDSTELKFVNTFVRRILDIVDIFMFFGLIAIVVIKGSRLSQRIGDIASETMVIKVD